MRPISQLRPPPPPVSPFESRAPSKANGIDAFTNLIAGEVKSVNDAQTDANEMIHSYLTGGDVNEAEALTSIQKADLAFRMLLQVRNKLMDAYREVQQIQI